MNSVERNQAIGLVLISAMLVAYFTFFSDSSKPQQTPANPKSTSTANVQEQIKATKTVNDTVALKKQYGSFSSMANGTEKTHTVNNGLIKATFNSKGAVLESVTLQKFNTYQGNQITLFNAGLLRQTQIVQTKNGNVDLSQLYASEVQTNDTSVVFRFTLGAGQYLQKSFSLQPKSYEISQTTDFVGMNEYLIKNEIAYSFIWSAPQLEKDLVSSRTAANANCRLMDGTFKSLSETSSDPQEYTAESTVNWITLKEKFFSLGIIADAGVTSAKIQSSINTLDSSEVKLLQASFIQTVATNTKLRFYTGPNKLNIVKTVAPDFVENVYLGWPVINTINRYTIAPLFELLEKLNLNYGLIIILMVIIIKAVLFPLSYRAYYAMAKIKVLKPELDEIKARVGDDMGAMQQEQMKLYNQVGVNPISGCIPVLLQMPVLLAMFNFFPNAIELRQQPFLWAEDLSTFDSVYSLPFKIPFYGDHVSLFALLMTASTILYTWYNSQMNVSATGPMMAMQYIMPLIFMFVLNSMPAGLSFYYFVSNMITIGQQFIIKMFVDENAIRAKLDDNKKNVSTRKPNRFQQRLMEAMEQQQELRKNQKPNKK